MSQQEWLIRLYLTIFVVSTKGKNLTNQVVFLIKDVHQDSAKFAFRGRLLDTKDTKTNVRMCQVENEVLNLIVDASFFVWVRIFVHRFETITVVQILFFLEVILAFFISSRYFPWLTIPLFSLLITINYLNQQISNLKNPFCC